MITHVICEGEGLQQSMVTEKNKTDERMTAMFKMTHFTVRHYQMNDYKKQTENVEKSEMNGMLVIAFSSKLE